MWRLNVCTCRIEIVRGFPAGGDRCNSPTRRTERTAPDSSRPDSGTQHQHGLGARRFPDGDPFLQRQNEPSIAVSTRNPLHCSAPPTTTAPSTSPAWSARSTATPGSASSSRSTAARPGRARCCPASRTTAARRAPPRPSRACRRAPTRWSAPAPTASSICRASPSTATPASTARSSSRATSTTTTSRPAIRSRTSARRSSTSARATRFLDKPWIAVDIPRGGGNGERQQRQRLTGRIGNKDGGKDKRKNDNGNGQRPIRSAGRRARSPGRPSRFRPARSTSCTRSSSAPPTTTTTGTNEQRQRQRRRPVSAGIAAASTTGTATADAITAAAITITTSTSPASRWKGTRRSCLRARSTAAPRSASRRRSATAPRSTRARWPRSIPNTGTIYVAWREFLSAAQPDAILVTRSDRRRRQLLRPGHDRQHRAVRSGHDGDELPHQHLSRR